MPLCGTISQMFEQSHQRFLHTENRVGFKVGVIPDKCMRDEILKPVSSYNVVHMRRAIGMMHDLALRIERVANTFSDPAQVYAFGIRTVLETATRDVRWKQLLHRSEVIANATFRRMGPFAIRDLKLAAEAGRFLAPDPELVWHMTTHAIVGVALAITQETLPASAIQKTVVRLLCMTGIGEAEANELANRARPELPAEEYGLYERS